MQIADGQLGLTTRHQLRAAGLSEHDVRQLLATGVLMRVFAGTYRTAGSIPSFEQRCLAATFAGGDDALISHHSALAVRTLTAETEQLVITVPERRRVRRPGIVAHHSDILEPVDRSMCGIVPVTSPARTLLDVAPTIEDAELELLSDRTFRRGFLTPHELVTYLERPELAHKRGTRRLRRIGRDRVEHGVPDSDLETPMLGLITSHRLPPPVRQFKVRLFGRNTTFDFAYPEERIVIETEGRGPHWGRLRWQSDHDRYNVVELGEWRAIRFTYEDVTERPAYVAFVIAEKLGLKPTGWRRKKRPPKA